MAPPSSSGHTRTCAITSSGTLPGQVPLCLDDGRPGWRAGPGALTGASGYRALAGAGLVLAGTLAFGAYAIVLRPVSQVCGAVPATAASTVIGTFRTSPSPGRCPRPGWPRS